MKDWKDVLADHLEDEWSKQEDRMNIIGQNGNSGLHYNKRCIITGVRLTEEDTYYENSGCPYANFVEKFRARNKIPVRDLRNFIETLKERM